MLSDSESSVVSVRRCAEQIEQTRRKGKPGRNTRKQKSPQGEMKYGVLVPNNVKQALAIDESNGDKQWQDAIKKERD